MSDHMRRVPLDFPETVRWFSGADLPWSELRSMDQRAAPAFVRRAHSVDSADIAGVDCVWLSPDRHPTGLILFLHGGAYVMGPGAGQWNWISALATATGMAALVPLYRRAPEHPFPAALDDALAVATSIDGQWVIAGDSAGGGLAVALCMRLRDLGAPLPRAMALSSPWVDLTLTNPAEIAYEPEDPMLTVAGLRRCADAYAGSTDRADPAISPLFGDLAGLPRMHVTVGTAELLLPEVRALAGRCRAAGTQCEVHEEPGGIHDYAIGVGGIPEADDALPRAATFLTGP